MWPWPTIKFSKCPKMTKKAVLGVSSDLNDEPFSKFFINFWLETIFRLLEIAFFSKGYERMQKNLQKTVNIWFLPIFPILRTPKCIGTRGCLEDQVNHLQTSWNFFSRFDSWIDTVKKWFSQFWEIWGKRNTLPAIWIFDQRDPCHLKIVVVVWIWHDGYPLRDCPGTRVI